MARILAYVPDLLFGSRVAGALQAAGHEVRLAPALPDPLDADLLIVDLTADAQTRARAAGAVTVPTLAFYSHVEAAVRGMAEEAGIDLVVPRSRMAREGPALVERLLAG